MPGVIDLIIGKLSPTSLALASVVVLASCFFYIFFNRPSLPSNAPKQARDQVPILGAWRFFTERHTWFEKEIAASSTGNFSYWVANKPVIGLSGLEGRRMFFDSKAMNFSEGYQALLAGAPPVKKNPTSILSNESVSDDSDFGAYFSRCLVAMLKGNQLAKGLPNMVKDVRARLDELASNPKHETDPFDSIYRVVYQLTMRTVACNEIASDDKLLKRSLHLYEEVENAASPWLIMFPWAPLYGKFKRTLAGAELYMIFKKIVDARAKEGRREDDALQFLIDQGDDITKIITFVLGALFAGQLNSGINAAWILLYLTTNKDIQTKVRAEVNAAADKYCSDKSLPLKERLMSLPIGAWENEFPLIDACLRESIRLQMPGTAFRRNSSGKDLPLSTGEVIPKDAYVTYLITDVHQDPTVYTNPMKWDPLRYSSERAEDKKVHHAGLMWGVSRHPCLGMKFAKLENNMITSFFLAYFDELEAWGPKGQLNDAPEPNLNFLTAHKPLDTIKIKYQLKK
ncbi:hypothetical protein AMS68_007694 [Peltaster fructicola]|uniref:Cytochrome P450 n=1 Tax=Peltaster fructicola TaxID=286661 RepID=A0A6H0Y554_9PEZI|nr:hypothetical protein AMS68_007694 [Peltaster fructicola]